MKRLQCFLLIVSLTTALGAVKQSENQETPDSNRVKRTDDVSLVSIQALLQQQASVIQALQAELAATKTRLQQLETSDKLQQAQIDLTTKEVAFSARLSHNQDNADNGVPLGAHQTLIFNDVVANVGQAYSATTGVFTAPVAGTYAFFLSQMAPNARQALFLSLVKNGVVLDEVFSEGNGDNYDQGSSQVTTHLVAGDQVWVRQESGDGVRAGYWTIFTGFLLTAGS